jgi:hypothetical protein
LVKERLVGKSKKQKERPGYVPKEGVFFDIKPSVVKSKIWANGKPLPGVTKAVISIDASSGLTKARIEMVALEGRVRVAEAQMVRRQPKNAPWGVTFEDEEDIEAEQVSQQAQTFKEKLQQAKNPVPMRVPGTADGIRAQIEEFELGGLHPYFDVQVTENSVPMNVRVDAKITMQHSKDLLNKGHRPTREFEDLCRRIVPAGCIVYPYLLTISSI